MNLGTLKRDAMRGFLWALCMLVFGVAIGFYYLVHQEYISYIPEEDDGIIWSLGFCIKGYASDPDATEFNTSNSCLYFDRDKKYYLLVKEVFGEKIAKMWGPHDGTEEMLIFTRLTWDSVALRDDYGTWKKINSGRLDYIPVYEDGILKAYRVILKDQRGNKKAQRLIGRFKF